MTSAIQPRRQFLVPGRLSEDDTRPLLMLPPTIPTACQRPRRPRRRPENLDYLRDLLPCFPPIAPRKQPNIRHGRRPSTINPDVPSVNKALLDAGYSQHFLIGSTSRKSPSHKRRRPFGDSIAQN